MIGAVVLVVLMLLLLPVLFLAGGVLAAAVGWLLADHGDATHADSPYRALNR